MIVTGGTVRKAVETTLKAFLPGALAVIAEEQDISLPPVRSWKRLPDFTDLAERLDPTVVVTAPGVPEVVRMGNERDQATWQVRVYVIAGGQNFEETADRVCGYVAALRAVLNSKPSLGGLASSARWTGETYDELSSTDSRSVGAGSVVFLFSVLTDRMLPPIDSVEVETVIIDVVAHEEEL